MTNQEALRSLPSVDAVMREMERHAHVPAGVSARYAREAVDEARAALVNGGTATAPTAAGLAERALALRADDERGSLRRVINASGVILQTNLGRAPLSARALAAMRDLGGGYTNLEFDLPRGARGSRHVHARDVIRRVTGAEDAMVVNNNAAAVLFVLVALAAGRGVLVSRGEAVEIGGGFRIPDIVAQSGARIVEVGTTNRTYVEDYAMAVEEETAAILRVHPSNFRVTGFTTRPALADLAALARARSLLLIDDLGSGALVPTEEYGLAHEPTVQESLAAGADLVLFSGDKLVGGPQCGVIAGRAALLEALRRHPLARALRVDKLTLAALHATLRAYADGTAAEEIPVWRMLRADPLRIRERAERWVAAAGVGEVVTARSMVGGGTLPEEGVETWAAAISSDTAEGGAEALSRALRSWSPPIVARIEHGRVLLDPRTVDEADDETVAEALAAVARS